MRVAFVTGCLCCCFSMEQHVRGLLYFLGLLQNLSEVFSPYLAFPSANSSNNIPGLTLGSPKAAPLGIGGLVYLRGSLGCRSEGAGEKDAWLRSLGTTSAQSSRDLVRSSQNTSQRCVPRRWGQEYLSIGFLPSLVKCQLQMVVGKEPPQAASMAEEPVLEARCDQHEGA